MAYSESEKTLEKIRPQLARLEAGNACIWTGLKGISGGSRRFAYKLREGLFIATVPQANLSREEKLKLHTWATGRHLMLFIADARVTMQPYTTNLAGLEWSPADED
jgi:hypothetical protein